ncbi:toll/interleukin-1 receptor domain-containing protein [Rhodococcus sp. SBT000017]|mgnify:CR=1 FL=1|uniref:toll/interleukin-1 receptor domain-containing protein n=1 Tax=unclassified Rhodococcus (in: high G+C Gram-positive bacteria) TaxID=192944 RepID=UPI000EF871B7|nr:MULTISPECIES: toll/interleukin-1 receptor domain-containing protein [unclassified Rhodococcus (in: high G+C Gram-positive bacteria)]RMB75301.1 toll/interleukin-1 receptor domain-containing protein [Rhodococcus sp. SBT000017]
MTPSDKFRLKSQILQELTESNEWDLPTTNLLLSEFGLPTMESWGSPPLDGLVAALTEDVLTEIYKLVLGADNHELDEMINGSDSEVGNWNRGYVRVFISHSAEHKPFVGGVAEELAITGIHGFVAHDTMTPTVPWQEQIEQGLRTMEAFVLLIHPEVNDSFWCHQETGWALGRGVPYLVIRMGADPVGFPSRYQWSNGRQDTARNIAASISTWIASLPHLGDSLVNGLLQALADVRNYVDAGAATERMASLNTLTETQYERLAEIWWSNDQLHGSVLAHKGLKPLYDRNNRDWPPTPRPKQG